MQSRAKPAWQRWRRVMALVLAVFLLLGLLPEEVLGAAEAGARRRTPVILIHGVGSSPAEAWGAPRATGEMQRPRSVAEAARTGYFTTLVKAGYVPGETLFWLDYSDAPGEDFIRLAGDRLAPLVETALLRSGAEQVDFIAHSMGALAARHYVERMGGDERVRSVVMLAAPHHGSFLASLLKNAGAVQAASREQPAPGVDWSVLDATFDGEASYVGRLAGRLFLPLARDVMAQRLGGGIRPGTAATLYEWLAGNHPAETRRLFDEAQVPADNRGVYPLTRAYLHLLALNAAADGYRTGLVEHVKVAEIPAPTSSNRWWQPLVGKVVNGLTNWGLETLTGWGRRLLRGSVLALAASQAGVTSDSPAVTRLVSEEVDDLNPQGLLANHFLAEWNEGAGSVNRQRAVQYVHVAGEAPNFWGLLFQDVDANDLAVETESTLLPPGPLDRYYRQSGWARAFHSGLLWDRAMQERILASLDPLEERQPVQLKEGVDAAAGAESEGVLVLRGDRATILAAALPPGRRQTGKLILTLEADRGLFGFAAKPLPRVGLAAWTGRDLERGLGPVVPFASGDTLEIPVEGGEAGPLLIAARLLPDANGELTWDWFGNGRSERMQFRLAWQEGGVAGAASDQAAGTTQDGMGGAPESAVGTSQGSAGAGPGPVAGPTHNVSGTPGPKAGPTQGSASGTSQPAAGAPQESAPGAMEGPGKGSAAEPPGPTAEPPGLPADPGDSDEGQDGGVISGCGEDLFGKHGAEADAWIEKTCPPPTAGLEAPPGPTVVMTSPTEIHLEVEQENDVKTIEVVQHNRLTTDRKSRQVIPERWEWDFGDGTREAYNDLGADTTTRRHRFPGPGEYRVTASSLANDGRLLREKSWLIVVAADEDFERELQLETIGETVPEIEIVGPVEWVVGRPAPFHLLLRLRPGRYLEKVHVDFDPGSHFEVQWKRPGTYVVRAAVTLRLNYRLPERRITLYNTYVQAVKVRVLGNSVQR